MARGEGSLPVASLRYAQRYFRSVHHLGQSERFALSRTLREMEAAEVLPAPETDVPDILPPSLPCFRRRIGASAWWVYFVMREEHATVVAVAVPP